MPTLSVEEILDRVNELKLDGVEKDDVIRDQQLKIAELQKKIEALEIQANEFDQQMSNVKEEACKAEELLVKLSETLGDE